MPDDQPPFSLHKLANAKFTYILPAFLRRLDDKTPPPAQGRQGRHQKRPGLAGAPGRDFDVLGAGTLGTLPHFERHALRSEEHTSELQSLMRSSSAVLCLKN